MAEDKAAVSEGVEDPVTVSVPSEEDSGFRFNVPEFLRPKQSGTPIEDSGNTIPDFDNEPDVRAAAKPHKFA